MGWTIGLPSLKLNMTGAKSKHCGNFYAVAAEALKERLGHDPDINPELSEKNIYEGYETAEELMAYSSEHCYGLKDSKGRALRSDSVRMCVTIIKPPAAFMATLSEASQKQFLDDSVEKLAEIVGSENVKSKAYHFDEQGAHVHVFWEPMTKDGRLCAKEMHNLKFLSRLNKEMPQHLRSRGWDIDDCNAYDQAKEDLKTEKEKSERRHLNGRNSAVFKADAERRLNEINQQIDFTIDTLEGRLDSILKQSVENVVNDDSGVYDNVMFLMAECDDERFAELDQEGKELKEAILQDIVEKNSPKKSLDKIIEDINSGKTKSVTWEQRQKMWAEYRLVSNQFWGVRARLQEDYREALDNAYERRRDALDSFYAAKCFLRRSKGFIALFAALAWVCVAAAQESIANKQIQKLREERQTLISNTASFKKFSNSYREELKMGKIPFEKYIESMREVVETLDEEAEKFKQRGVVEPRRDKNLPELE